MADRTPDIRISSTDFGHLFTRYRPKFVSIACSYVRDRGVADDLVTDSFLYFWENREKLPPDVNIPGYVLTTLKHKCLNYLRDRAIHARVERDLHQTELRVIQAGIRSLETSKPARLFAGEVQQIVEREVEAMPDPMREIFIRSRYLDKTYREIAEEFGMSLRAVEYEIQKAMKVLRLALRDYLPLLVLILALWFEKYMSNK